MFRTLLTVLIIGMLHAGNVFAQPAQPQLPAITLSAGIHLVRAEVASTMDTRMQGLMNRQKMLPNQGMLFVFTENAQHCMWMKNTLLPLSVAFIDDAGKILNIEDMEPQSEVSHCAARPARFALEMNLGWFKKKGLKPGIRLKGLEKAPKPR